MRRRLVLLAAVVALAGCAPVTVNAAGVPQCEHQGAVGSPAVLLMAQAVPSAAEIPCITLLPDGWTFGGDLFVRNGLARFSLDSDRAGLHAVQVVFQRDCTTAGATRVPSDETGTRRYEVVTSVRSGFAGRRTYLFKGGCVTYDFHLAGEARAAPIGDASLALGFVRRADLAAAVEKGFHGRVTLDPTTTS